jgi:hypothetical protein
MWEVTVRFSDKTFNRFEHLSGKKVAELFSVFSRDEDLVEFQVKSLDPEIK